MIEAADTGEAATSEGPIPSPLRRLLAVGMTVFAVWLPFVALLTATNPPTSGTLWPLVVSVLVSLAWFAFVVVRPWVRVALGQSPISLAAASVAALAAASVVVLDDALFVLTLFVAPLAGIVTVSFAVFRVRRHPLDSIMTLACWIGLFVLLATADSIGLSALRLRVALAEDRYRGEAEQVLASPIAPADPNSGPFQAVDVDGNAVVAWQMAAGVPARAWGLVYDPESILAGGDQVASEGYPYIWSKHQCDALFGPWHWCRLT